MVILLAVLVVAVLAVVGLVIYQHHKSSPKGAATTHSSQTTNKQTNATSSNGTTQTPPTNQNTNTFTIPELSAKMTLPDGLTPSDLKYTITTDIGVPAAGFTTASLEQMDGTGNCSAAQGSIGIIWRTTQNPASGSVTVKQIGQYYYAFEKPQDSCTSNVNAEKLKQSQTALLQQAFDTITATN